MKKLSIITICYNEPDVEKTCESIVNQTWQDFEWIVIDGGSNKETLDVFEKYKDKIEIVPVSFVGQMIKELGLKSNFNPN